MRNFFKDCNLAEYTLGLIALVVLAALLISILRFITMATPASAQSAVTYGYLQDTVSINSTTVPVLVIPALTKSSWFIRLRAAGTNPVLCFAFTGPTTPATAPTDCASAGAAAGCVEVSAGSPLFDGMNAPDNNFQTSPFTQGWACILESSGAETMDGLWR